MTTPAFFWGACAAALIPILLHLAMRGRPKREIFPAFRFVRETRGANRRRFALKQFLLLSLRCAVILLFGLLLARPVVCRFTSADSFRDGEPDGGVNAVFVFDTSARMEYRRENRTRLDEAKDFALGLLRRLPEGSRAAVLDSSAAGDAFQIDVAAAEDRIRRIQTVLERRSVAESVAEGIRLLAQETGKKELFILTDRTAAGWPAESVKHIEQLLKKSEEGEGIRYYFADFSVPEPSDVSLSAPSVSVSETGDVEIGADITELGTPEGGRLELHYSEIGSDAETVQTETFAGSAGTEPFQERVHFHLNSPAPGFYQGTIQKTPPDPLDADDQVFFTFRIGSPKRIVLVAPEPVETKTFFLREAAVGVGTEFAVETVPFEDFGKLRLDRAGISAVLFLDTPPLADSEAKRLGTFIRSGGGAGFFLGGNAGNTADFPEYLRLLGGKPVRVVRVPEGTSMVSDPNSSNLLAGFRTAGGAASVPWDELPVFRYWGMEWNGEPQPETPLRYVDGRPAVVVKGLDEGRIIIATTPFSEAPDDDEPWNRITTGDHAWIYLILVDGIIRTLAGKGDNLMLEPFEIWNASREEEGNLSVHLPNGETVPIRRDESGKSVRFSGTGIPGSYLVTDEKSAKPVDGFSVNNRAGLFCLETIPFETIQKAWGDTPLTSIRDPESMETARREENGSADLYALFAALLACVLASELFVACRFYRTP